MAVLMWTQPSLAGLALSDILTEKSPIDFRKQFGEGDVGRLMWALESLA